MISILPIYLFQVTHASPSPHTDALPFYLKLGFAPFHPAQYHPTDISHTGPILGYPVSLPALDISPAEPSSTPHLARIHREAFGPGAIYQSLWRDVDPAAFEVRTERRFRADLEEGKREKKAIWVVRRGEREVGFACWDLPFVRGLEEGKREEKIKEREFDEGTHVEVAGPFFVKLEEHGRKIQGPHYRECLSVDFLFALSSFE